MSSFRRRNFCLVIFFCIVGTISGLTCDSDNSLLPPKSCPGFFDDSDDQYCCLQGGSYKCCDAEEYFTQAGLGVVITIIVALVIGTAVACCLCCLCCPCCLLYKRRNRGAVYGPGMQTTVVTVPQATQPPPTGYVQNQPNMPYPIQPMGTVPAPAFSYPGYAPVPQPIEQMQPPPYSVATSTEAYPKQAPYNPAY